MSAVDVRFLVLFTLRVSVLNDNFLFHRLLGETSSEAVVSRYFIESIPIFGHIFVIVFVPRDGRMKQFFLSFPLIRVLI